MKVLRIKYGVNPKELIYKRGLSFIKPSLDNDGRLILSTGILLADEFKDAIEDILDKTELVEYVPVETVDSVDPYLNDTPVKQERGEFKTILEQQNGDVEKAVIEYYKAKPNGVASANKL